MPDHLKAASDAAAAGFSVRVILDRLSALGLNKTDFARRLGVSQDYVYRILNGRIAFPRARETLERMAEILALDPVIFPEYRARDEQLSLSARLVWERMKELDMTREELFQAMGGRISRPYFNSILRGDQPFPTNRAFIQLFALALSLPPTAFPEFGHKQAPRWSDEDLAELEEKAFALFFDKMMADYGFVKFPLTLRTLDSDKVMAFFPPRAAYPPALQAVLHRMGELGMGFKELGRVSGIPTERLRELFTRAPQTRAAARDIETLAERLRMAADGGPDSRGVGGLEP